MLLLPFAHLLASASPALSAPNDTPGFEFRADEPQAPAERKWTGSVAINASSSDGNTDKNTIGASVQAENKGATDRWSGQLFWNYADEKGVGVTQRRTYGQLKYDYFFDPKMYAWAAVSGENDFGANLKLRTTIGAGVGYQFHDDKQWKVQGEVGLAYVDEDFKELPATPSSDKDYLAARLAYKADYTSEDGKWTAGNWGEIFPSLESGDDISARLDTHGRVNLTDKMFAQLQWIMSWDNTPSTGSDRVDDLYLFSLGWSF